MGLRDRLRRLERAGREETIVIPQTDGTIKRFPQSVAAEAFLALCEGREHPLLEAARSSSDAAWSEGVYSTVPTELRNIEDLSE